MKKIVLVVISVLAATVAVAGQRTITKSTARSESCTKCGYCYKFFPGKPGFRFSCSCSGTRQITTTVVTTTNGRVLETSTVRGNCQ